MTRSQILILLGILISGTGLIVSIIWWGLSLNNEPTAPTLDQGRTRAVGITVVALAPITTTPLPIITLVTLNTPTSVIAPTNAPATVLPTLTPNPPTSTRPPTQVRPTVTPTSKYNLGAAPIPGPSPTWSVNSFLTRAPANGPSKLGFHATLNGQLVLEYVAKVKPPVMKGVDDIIFLKKVKEVSPTTITLGRYVVPQLNIGVGDPTQRAIEFVNEWLPRYREHASYVDYWEGWNEVTYPNYEWFAQFEATRACEMHKHGFKTVIGNFSAGTPEPWQFETFLPAIEAGLRCNAILGLHEYGAPTMYLWWAQGMPASLGKPAVPAYPDRGPVIGRYRFFYRDILIPRNLVMKLVITETGVDGLVGQGQGRPGYSTDEGPGWKGFMAYWSKDLKREDPTSFYVEQLAWYDSLLRQDEYVLGATIFNVAGGTNAQFTSYEPTKELLEKLTTYALGVK